MLNDLHTKRILSFVFASILCTFAMGFLFNSYYQAGRYHNKLIQNSRMAVFLEQNSNAPLEVIGEKLVNLDGVEEVEFVSKEKVLENALNIDSSIKDVLITGDNPFTHYFLVRPHEITMDVVEELKGKVESIEGIEEVRYDQNSVLIAEGLMKFIKHYRIGGKILLIAGLIIIAVKLVLIFIPGKPNYLDYLYLIAIGIVSNILGVVLYYSFSYHFFSSDILQLPSKYALYLLTTGIIAGFVWES